MCVRIALFLDFAAFWHDEIEGWFMPIMSRLFQLADLRPGQCVLDIGTGYGEPALSAAARVGPAGHVLGIDVSRAMLEAARRRARDHSNVEFAEADIETLDESGRFDVATSSGPKMRPRPGSW
jgi:ubiquinone/menaquinone biosynthesis C-methylase UbiE